MRGREFRSLFVKNALPGCIRIHGVLSWDQNRKGGHNMLNQQELTMAKGRLSGFLRGKQRGSEPFARNLNTLAYDITQARRSSGYDGWLRDFREDRSFLENMERMLCSAHRRCRDTDTSPFQGLLYYRSNQGLYRAVCTYDFWADCVPSWKEGRGFYGTSPGEDVLILLAAGKS